MVNGLELFIDSTLGDAIWRWEEVYDFDLAADRILSCAGGLS